jgi:hypothetical protein
MYGHLGSPDLPWAGYPGILELGCPAYDIAAGQWLNTGTGYQLDTLQAARSKRSFYRPGPVQARFGWS